MSARHQRDGCLRGNHGIRRGGVLLLDRQVSSGLEVDRIVICGKAVLDEQVIAGIHLYIGWRGAAGRHLRGDCTIGFDVALVGPHLNLTVGNRDCAVVAGLLDRNVLLGPDNEVRLCAIVKREHSPLVEHHAAKGCGMIGGDEGCGRVKIVSAEQRYARLGLDRAGLGRSADLEIVVCAERHAALGGLDSLCVGEDNVAAVDLRPLACVPGAGHGNGCICLVMLVVIDDLFVLRVRCRGAEGRRRVGRVEDYVALVGLDIADRELGVIADGNAVYRLDVDIAIHLVGPCKRHKTLGTIGGIGIEVGGVLDLDLAAGTLGYVAVHGVDGQSRRRGDLVEFDIVLVGQAHRGALGGDSLLEVVVRILERDVRRAGVKTGRALHNDSARILGNGAVVRRDDQVAIVRRADVVCANLAERYAARTGRERNVVAGGVDLRTEDVIVVVGGDVVVRGRIRRIVLRL